MSHRETELKTTSLSTKSLDLRGLQVLYIRSLDIAFEILVRKVVFFRDFLLCMCCNYFLDHVACRNLPWQALCIFSTCVTARLVQTYLVN